MQLLPLYWILMSFSPVYIQILGPVKKVLELCHININHIINKIDEISYILFSNNLDTYDFTESRLNKNIDKDEIQIPGYYAERRDSSSIHHS